MSLSAPVRAKATLLAAKKIKEGVNPRLAIYLAIEEAGGNAMDSYNRSDVARQLQGRSAAKKRLAKKQIERLDREVRQITPVVRVRPAPTESEQAKWRAMDARRMGEKEE